MTKTNKLKTVDRELVVLLICVVLIGVIVYKDFFFLKNLYVYLDIGIDTYNQYWPYLNHLSNMIYSGSFSFWSFEIGAGASIFSASMLTDPFNIFAALLGPKLLVYSLPYIALGKVMLAAVGFYKYLNYLKLNKLAILIVSLIYAYNGYIILWGQHYHFGAILVFIPFALWGIEVWFRERKASLYIFSVFLISFSSFYFLYIFALFFVVYVVVRYFEIYEYKFKEFISFLFKIAMLSILAIGLSSFVLLPSLYVALTNQRVSFQLVHEGMFGFAGVLDYITIILRLFSNDIIGTGNQFYGWGNYYEAPILFTGNITILLIPLFFFYSRKKDKIVYGILGALLILFLIFPFFSFMFNAFSAYSYRWTFIIIVFMNLINAKSLHCILEEKKKIDKFGLAYLIGLIIFVGMASLLLGNDLLGWGPNFTHSFKHLLFSIILIAAYAIILRNITYKACRQALLILVCIEMALFSSISVNREMFKVSNLHLKSGYNDYTNEVIDYINSIDGELMRIDKSYTSGYLADSVFQGYNGVKSYSSLNNPSYVNFLRGMGVPFKILDHPNFLTGLDSNTNIARLLAVKYLLVNNEAVVPAGYELINEVDNIKLYKDKYYLPLGFAYSNVISMEDFQKLNNEKKSETLFKAFISADKSDLTYYQLLKEGNVDMLVENVLIDESKVNSVNIEPISGNLTSSYKFNSVNTDPQIFFPISLNIGENQKWKISMKISSSTASQVQLFYDVDSKFNEENSVTIDYAEGETYIEKTFNYTNINQLRIDVANKPGEFTISDLKIQVMSSGEIGDLENLRSSGLDIIEYSDDYISGEIQTKEPMKLFVSIPYDEGWEAKVNGISSKISNINNGFIGIDLSPGSNNIELKFVPPFLGMGRIISILSLLIIIFLKWKMGNTGISSFEK